MLLIKKEKAHYFMHGEIYIISYYLISYYNYENLVLYLVMK